MRGIKHAAIAAVAMMAATAEPAAQHPLDGLTATEIEQVTAILREAGEAGETTRYPLIELIEPAKSEVLAATGPGRGRRRASVHLMDEDGTFRKAAVDISNGVVESAETAAGEPMLLVEEFTTATAAALEHPEMAAGLARRGLTADEVFCLPLTAGYYATPEHEGTRLMKVPCYAEPEGSNHYSRPVEGLFAVVDLKRGTAIRVVDEGSVPLAAAGGGYTEEEVARERRLREPRGRVDLIQRGEPGYTIDGPAIEWDIWRFRVRVDKRPGIVLSKIEVRDEERWRSVLYQAHLSEVFVPYMDPAQGWYWRTYMDSGEYGFGLFLTRLTKGVDCPEHAALLPAIISGTGGAARDPGRDLRVREVRGRPGVAALRGVRRDERRAGTGGRPRGHRAGGANGIGRGQLRLPDRLPLPAERRNEHRRGSDGHRRGEGSRNAVDDRRGGRLRHAPRHADRTEPGGPVPRPLLQLPTRLRRRRTEKPPGRAGRGGGDREDDRGAAVAVASGAGGPRFRTRGPLQAERDGAEVLHRRERASADPARAPPGIHDPPRQRGLRPVRLRRGRGDEAQRLHRVLDLDERLRRRASGTPAASCRCRATDRTRSPSGSRRTGACRTPTSSRGSRWDSTTCREPRTGR